MQFPQIWCIFETKHLRYLSLEIPPTHNNFYPLKIAMYLIGKLSFKDYIILDNFVYQKALMLALNVSFFTTNSKGYFEVKLVLKAVLKISNLEKKSN